MLRHVAVGIAMGDAPASVRAVADEVTGRVAEDGLRAAFLRHGLIADNRAKIGDAAEIIARHQGRLALMDKNARRDLLQDETRRRLTRAGEGDQRRRPQKDPEQALPE